MAETETEPVAGPALVGEKLKVAVTDWDGLSVNGVVIGNILKPAPVTVTWLTVIAAVDELVTVTFWVAVAPTVTCPNEIELRLLPRDPEFPLPPPFELLELAVTPPHPQRAIKNRQTIRPASFRSLSTGSSRYELSHHSRARAFIKGAG